jgi:hypothetical protein
VRIENLFGARQNHLPSERDDRPDVLPPSAIHLTLKSKNRLDAESAILRHQLTVLERKIRARIRLTPMAIAYPSFGPIVGFPQCWRRFGSSTPTPRCGGMVPVFDVTGVEVPTADYITNTPEFSGYTRDRLAKRRQRRLIARCRGSIGGLIQWR